MNEQQGSKILVDCLENENIEYVFGIPGEQTIPVMEEFRKSSIEFVPVRHEQGAAFMADVYSRVSGRPGVCLSTLGPGATNLVTGIGNASLDYSSVVAITSQRKISDQHKHAHQFVDTNSIFEAVTKLTDEIVKPETIPEQVRKAFEVAGREKQGATHLEVPLNATQETADVEPLEKSQTRVSPSGVQPENVTAALEIVETAENPLILAGQEVISQNAATELQQFADSTGIPVVTTFMGKGAVDARSDKSVGTIGFGTDDYAMTAVKQADAVITVGYDYIEFHPGSWNVGTDKDIVHVDTRAPEIDKDYGVELTLIGNIRRILEQFNTQSETYVDDAYAEGLKAAYQRHMDQEYSANAEPPFTPQQAVRAIRNTLDDEDILISDVGSHKYWFSRRYPTYEPGSFLVSNGFASMGVALPGSISASLYSDDNVVAVNGDGGFLMNVQELETAVRLGVDSTVIVLDDSEYTAITMEQSNEYVETYGSSFDNPDFVALAESFGAEGYRVTEADKMEAVLDSAVSSSQVSVVAVPIDPTESYKLDEDIR